MKLDSVISIGKNYLKMSELLRLCKGLWMLANPKIWVASAVPLLVGASAAYMEVHQFSLYWFVVSVVGIFLIETGKHAINEWIDYITGVDRFVEPDKITPFSGGRRTLTKGILTVPETIAIAILAMGAAACIGLYVVFFREISVLWIGLAGFTIATFYTLPPMKLIYNGLGEIAVGITYGPLIVMGAYLVQAHTLTLLPFAASISVGFLIVNVLWINQFPDYEADKRGNKRNWVVRIGKQKSLYVYAAIYILAYLSIIALSLFTHKVIFLLAMLSIPIAFRSVRVAFKHYNDIPKLVAANVKTIQVYLLTGVITAICMLII